MFHLTVQHFARSLRNLDAVLAKAEVYAKARNFDVNNFMTARLAPDMLPFPMQVRIACDNAKALASNLAGKEAPKHEDNETNFEQLRGRITRLVVVVRVVHRQVQLAQVEQLYPRTCIRGTL